MKTYQKLKRFPLGCIRPEGFLREQMLRSKAGMGGYMDALEPEMIAYPFLERRPIPKWTPERRDAWSGEISGNFWSATIQMGFILGDEALIQKATHWVDEMLKNQQDDGYLGTYNGKDSRIYEDFNAWGTACCMRGLLAFYEATGREDVLDAVHRCMLWFCDKWAGDRKTTYAGPFLIEPMVLCYHLTGDRRLIEFAEDYERFICEHDDFRLSYRSLLEKELQYNSNHTAGYGTQTRVHAVLYTATGKEEYLHATVRAVDQLRAKAMHLTGSPVSVTEYLAPVSPTAETEYCSYTVFNATYSYLSYITGEGRYGDYMEEAFYNGAQGARKKDETAIAYLNSPNQLYATKISTAAGNHRDMQIYSPCYTVSCCPVNSVLLLPEFVRGMLLRDAEENIYLTVYGPCRLELDGFSLEERTAYPFRNTVELHLTGHRSCSLFLRIPLWARGYEITVNGRAYAGGAPENGYVEVRGAWKTGDTVVISFRAETEVIRVDDSGVSGRFPLAVRRGALVYAFHVPEKWKAEGRELNVPGFDWWSVTADYEPPQVYDPYEAIGLRRYCYSWNIALDERIKGQDIIMEELPTKGYPWETPWVRLHLTAYRAPFLNPPYATRTLEPHEDLHFVDKPVELTLVPYGCTNLRITYFPRADMSTFEAR